MPDFLEKLRSKPEHHRKNIAFGSALGITAIIFFVWISLVTTGMYSYGGSSETASTTISGEENYVATVESVSKPFSLLKSTVSGAFSNIGENIKTFLNQPFTPEMSSTTQETDDFLEYHE